MLENQERELRGRERRWRRLVLRGRSAVYHVMSRMVRRQFWLGEEEREVFAAMVRKQAEFTGVEVLTYCIMGNHFHLLIRVPEGPLREDGEHLIDDAELLRRYERFYGDRFPLSAWSVEELRAILEGDDMERAERERRRVLARMGDLTEFVREVKHRFSVWFNDRHGNEGTIWSSRFKSLVVEDEPEVLTKVGAYIDLNPVRARLVADPADYRWSGFGEAMAGVKVARIGIQALFGSTAVPQYREAITTYRLVLYGKGMGGKPGADGKDIGVIDPTAVAAALAANGKVNLVEALRCGVRYFTSGTAVGSKQFIEQCFQENRDLFSPRRRVGGSPMLGGCWEGMYSTRKLVKRVFG